MVRCMEDNVSCCFNSKAVDETEVDRLVSTIEDGTDSEAEVEEAKTRIKQIWTLMKEGAKEERGGAGAGFAIRQSFDRAFVHNLGSTSDADIVFANHTSQRWKEGMATYWEDVIDDLPAVAKIMRESNAALDADEQSDIDTLQYSVAKIKVMRSYLFQNDPMISMNLLPFMSRSVYVHMVQKLELIEDSLREVSSKLCRISGIDRNAGYLYTLCVR